MGREAVGGASERSSSRRGVSATATGQYSQQKVPLVSQVTPQPALDKVAEPHVQFLWADDNGEALPSLLLRLVCGIA